MKRLFRPFLVLILGCIGLFALNTYIYFAFKEPLLIILNALYLFLLGMSMNERRNTKKANKLTKIIVVVLLCAFILIQLNAIKIDIIQALVAMLGLTNVMYCAIYVYLGYLYKG